MCELADVLPERDFVLLQHYAVKRMLPAVRVEYMLAQVAKLVTQAAGYAPDAVLSDFLLRPRDDEADAGPQMTADVGAALVAGMTGAKVIYMPKKKGPADGNSS